MLKTTGLHNLFPSFEANLLKEIEQEAEIIQYEKGEELMRSGQNIKFTILIKKGLVKIFREDEEGNEIFMYYLEPGQACALSIMCAIQNRTSEIKAIAEKNTEVLAIPVLFVEQWMKEYRSWYQFIISTYRARFEDLLNTIDAIAFKNMDERIILYLKKQSGISGKKIISITHAQIASELSTSREVVSRLLKKLEEKGLIKLNRQHIEILNLDGLLV